MQLTPFGLRVEQPAIEIPLLISLAARMLQFVSAWPFLEMAVSRFMSCFTISLALSSLYIVALPIFRVINRASDFSSSFPV